MVLGGGLEYRPFAAAEFYRRGLVPKILVSNIGAGPAERLGVLRSHVRANMEVLEKLGVLGAAIEPFGEHLSRIPIPRRWRCTTGPSATAPTPSWYRPISSPRVGCAGSCTTSSGNDAVVLGTRAQSAGLALRDDWWKNERGIIGFQNEVVAVEIRLLPARNIELP